MYSKILTPDIEYTDDMCLVDSIVMLEEMLQDLDECCNEMGLIISALKTRIMTVGETQQQNAARNVHLQLVEEPVSIVNEFEYLQGTVMSHCGLNREINTRMRKTCYSFRCLSRIVCYQ